MTFFRGETREIDLKDEATLLNDWMLPYIWNSTSLLQTKLPFLSNFYSALSSLSTLFILNDRLDDRSNIAVWFQDL